MHGIFFWMLVGIGCYLALTATYAFSGRFNKYFGNCAEYFLLPGIWLLVNSMLAIAILCAFTDDTVFNVRDQWYCRKARWVADELARSGIRVIGYKYNWLQNALSVRAELGDAQITPYCYVYERAIKAFPKWSPREICSGADPGWPLDARWAKRIGITEYFAETFLYCASCPNRGSMGFRWGDAAYHADPFPEVRKQREVFALKDGSKKTATGWLCVNCRNKLPWISSRTYFD